MESEMSVKPVKPKMSRVGPGKPKQHSKKARLLARLSRKRGASITVLCSDFGWQPHSVRAAVSGLRKSGHVVECTKGRAGSIYRIARRVGA
jgi:DNA-binding transcriptional regulator PaaX